MASDSRDSLCNFLRDDEIVLATKKGSCRVRKSILLNSSQYFEVLFTHQHSSLWKENQERTVHFDWLSIDILVLILKFIEDKASCEFKSKTQLFQVAQASDFFNIETLKLEISNIYESILVGLNHQTRDNIIKVISVVTEAEICNLERIIDKCVHWLAKHFMLTWIRPEYARLSPELRDLIYKRAVEIVCNFNGKTLIHVQDIEKLKASLCSNASGEFSQLAQKLENELKKTILDNFPAFTKSLILADGGVSKIAWLYDYLGHMLKHVCSNLTVDNICKIYMANESIRNHGMLVKWREETVMRRFSVLDDKCMNFFSLNVQLIKLERREEWDSLPLMVKEQIDRTHHYKTNAFSNLTNSESSDRGFLFISLSDKPTSRPPASFLRHVNRPPRASRASTDRSVQRASSTRVIAPSRKVQPKAAKVAQVAKASSVREESKQRNAATSVREEPHARGHVTRELIRKEPAAVVPKLNYQIKPRSNIFALLPSTSRIPIPVRFGRPRERPVKPNGSTGQKAALILTGVEILEN